MRGEALLGEFEVTLWHRHFVGLLSNEIPELLDVVDLFRCR